MMDGVVIFGVGFWEEGIEYDERAEISDISSPLDVQLEMS